MSTNYSDDDVMRSVLRRECVKAGGRPQWCKEHGFSTQFICDVLKGRREISNRLANVLGYEKLVVYMENRE